MNLPNKLTVFRIFLIPVFMLIIIFGGDAHTEAAGSTVVWSWVIAAIVFAVASATDWFDGHIARSRNMVTNFGKFADRSEEHTSELQSRFDLVCRLLLAKK